MIAGARLATIVAIACGAVALAQPPVRDNRQTVVGTASVSGTVFLAGEGRQPARRVRVTLTSVTRTSPGQTATSGDDGSFAFRGLQAGQYELQAFKPAYLRASYGASRPDRAGTPVVVKDGEAVTNLAMTIVRGGVITGLVRDVAGRPVPGMTVRVLKLGYSAATGERSLAAPGTSSVSRTDDRGEYRAYGLPPGGYIVAVVPPPSAGRGGDIRQLTAAEVQQALQSARAGAAAAASVPGASPRPATAPGSLSLPAARLNYAPIFHPGATDISAAAPIALGVGEERGGVDITMQLVPSATVSGTVTSTTGALPSALSVALLPVGPYTGMLAGAGLRLPSAPARPDGTYVLGGVPPGAYTLKAIVGGGRGAAPAGPAQWAAAEVIVDGRDQDVPLTLQPGVPINGRVVFEGAQPSPAEIEALSFTLVAPGSGGQALPSGIARVDASGRFTLAGVVPDTYHFITTWNAAGAASRWTIRTAAANGREAFEAPLRVSPGEPVEWTITFTDTPATLSGVFKDRAGRAAADYFVLVFPADRQLWTAGSRRIRTARPATDGTFSIKGLPAGQYFLAALADLESGEWNDPTLLEQLERSSVKVMLRDGETTTQNFEVGGG